MTNPVNQNPSQFPPINLPFVDTNKCITPAWYRSYLGIWERTGGPNGINSGDATVIAQQALTLAQTAQATASLALANATAAQNTANTAGNSATNAQTSASQAANAASAISTSALLKASNLSDVASVTISRNNLGVSTFQVSFTFDTLTSNQPRYVPIVRAMTIPANFNGTQSFCGTLPTADAVFTLQRIRSGTTTTIGTITLIHGGLAFVLSTQAAVSLIAGDVLGLIAPSGVDVTLAYVGISVRTTLA